MLYFDIEADNLAEVTTKKKGKWWVVQPEVSQVWCMVVVDMETNDEKLYVGEEEIRNGVERLARSSCVVGHNVCFYDIPVLHRLFGLPLDTMFVDTCIVSKLMHPILEDSPITAHSLEAWGKYLQCAKGNYSDWSKYTDEMGRYCIQDCRVGVKIYEKQLKWIQENKALCKMEHEVSRILARQQENGFRIDEDAIDALDYELTCEICSLEDHLQAVFPPITTERWSEKTGKRLKDSVEIFNPGSTHHIASRFNSKYGWCAPITEKGNPKVDKEVISSLTYPEAKDIARIKLLTTERNYLQDYQRRLPYTRDGKLHASTDPQRAVTGRMGSSQPNLQNVNREGRVRSLFIPRDGWSLVGVDASGLEARMLAHFLYPFDNGAYARLVLTGDIHANTMKVVGIKDRNVAKTFMYAVHYGAKERKITMVLGVSWDEAGKAIKKYKRGIVGLEELINNLEVEHRSYMRTHSTRCGRIKLIDGRLVGSRKLSSVLNTLCQGCGAVIMKRAQIILDDILTKEFGIERWAWCATVHDEFQIECEPAIAEEVSLAGQRAIKEAGEFYATNIPLAAEGSVGENWGETH